MSVPQGCDETLLVNLCGKEQENLDDLSSELKAAVDMLKKRTLLTVELKTKRVLSITEEGKVAAKEAQIFQEVTQLTPELIITGKWHTT